MKIREAIKKYDMEDSVKGKFKYIGIRDNERVYRDEAGNEFSVSPFYGNHLTYRPAHLVK